MDLALYRAVERIGGVVISVRPTDEGDPSLVIRMDRPANTVLKVDVNRRLSPRVTLFGDRVMEVVIPEDIRGLDPRSLVVRIFAEVTYDRIGSTAVPSSIGIGLRPTTVDGELQALQTAIRSLRMSPGSDIWDYARGGGLLEESNTLYSREDTQRIARRFQVAVQRYNEQAAKIFGIGRTRSTVRRRIPTHRVTRMEVQAVKVLVREDVENRLGIVDGVGFSVGQIRSALQSSELVIAASILTSLRGPNGSTSRVSTALTA